MRNIRLFVLCSCILICAFGFLGILVWTDYHTATASDDSLPYYYEIFEKDGIFPHWEKDYVNVGVEGQLTDEDWQAIQNVLNEWNYKIKRPKLLLNNTDPDILIEWKYEEDVEWAGATWIDTGGDKIIESAHIIIRTSWPHSREHVIRHELGHAMGLSYHSNHTNSTMYKYATGVDCWSNEDLEVINTLYHNN
jgi:hypothetical protein